MVQLGFSSNISLCIGCLACIVACLNQNDQSGNDPAFRHVTRLEKGEYPSLRISFLPIKDHYFMTG